MTIEKSPERIDDNKIAEAAIVCWEALVEHSKASFRLVALAQRDADIKWFQDYLKALIERLKVISGETISEEIQKKTKKWSICNPAFIEDVTHIAVQAQLDDTKRELLARLPKG